VARLALARLFLDKLLLSEYISIVRKTSYDTKFLG
jgi:hypothetical protein